MIMNTKVTKIKDLEARQHRAAMRESALRFRTHVHPDSCWVGSFSTRMGWAAAAVSQAITYRDLANDLA
jgi:hypothetical protein